MENHPFFNQMPGLLQVVTATGEIIAVSDRWLQMLGYERATVLGRPFTDFLSTATQTRVQTAYLPLLRRTGQLQDVAAEFIQSNGEVVDLLAEVTTTPGVAGEPLYYLIALRDSRANKQAEALLFTLAKGTAKLSGSDFFRSLVSHLAQAFDVHCALVTECANRSLTRVRTLAYIDQGQFLENIEYDLAGTPCEVVMTGVHCYYPAKLSELFPAEASEESYLGVPLFDAQGQIIGHLAVIDDKPMVRTARDLAILEIFAARAGAELERKQAERALVEERERLARELHDSVTQSLYSLTLLTEGWRRLAKAGQFDQADTRLAELGAISQQALRETRLLVYELRPLALAQDGLLAALQQRLNAVEKQSGMEAHLLVDGLLNLPRVLEVELYRMAQEGLNRTLKQSNANRVTLRIEKNAQNVLLEVTDNGQSVDLGSTDEQGAGDINHIQRRAEKLGGTATLITAPGQATILRVCVPL
jgi:PAS domain S-box-containing protein